MRITAKVLVVRADVPGSGETSYRVESIVGPAEVTVPARVSNQQDRTLVVGDRITHEELKRLCDVKVYQVQTRAQKG